MEFAWVKRRHFVVNDPSFGKLSWPGWAARDFILFALIGAFTLGFPWPPTSEQNSDNTRQSRSPDATRSDQQGQSSKDRELTRKIRRAVVSDKSLSTNAHNVKIIVRNGVVTLRGPVRAEEEKNAINAKAAQIVGASNVKDEITVMPKSWRDRRIYGSTREEMRASPVQL